MTAILEHANLCVSDPHATAAWMEKVFGWRIRWQGPAIHGGLSVHVGSKDSYLALYTPPEDLGDPLPRYANKGTLNHLALIVEDLDRTEEAVREVGFTPMNHADYEPGRRFYFLDGEGVEYELVQYD
ncbi:MULTISPECIES: VOC family protein [Rhodobacterales]|jgi:catechol 2,3-dioxygenase-like lactoylglutathione lyase family enzyme|uniref:VOC family protein n=1 Tax=Rhodobacterales TaxID=204455 RepID=UPI00237F5225|nr:VOC family protein [Phaeobacter gallaeciensis]MDE4140294.1 VOC family protein [Phaeobacter gallaeciensis]MDE4149013.1 VOC family protein [Phaeobacter gallaeciensis]MDE4153235.1 VOC family protein [Phaeobacter gallaeciensis]MDE4228351.1 VOC family protein [Phaeobacter gallaeciensis]MDE4257427.1 VOC family protein [Phaeobacter gallaeciensis]